MFRDLGNLFEKKKRLVINSEDSSVKIIEITNNFLKNQFSHSSQNKLFSISYNHKEKTLLVEAGNKIWANELSLRLTDLYTQFQKENIKLSKVLIR